MTTQTPAGISLILEEKERALLQQLLEQAVIDTHVERRRTEAPAFHELVAREEALLRTLLDKVRQARP
jgi:hypothetical protein